MEIRVLIIFQSLVAVAQCFNSSFLLDLSTLDLKQVIHGIFTTNHNNTDLPLEEQITDVGTGLRSREYDWEKCVVDLGGIADGLNRMEMWAMQGMCVDLFAAELRYKQN